MLCISFEPAFLVQVVSDLAYRGGMYSSGGEILNVETFMSLSKFKQYLYVMTVTSGNTQISVGFPGWAISRDPCSLLTSVWGDTALDYIRGVLDDHTPELGKFFRISPSFSHFYAEIEGSWPDSGW